MPSNVVQVRRLHDVLIIQLLGSTVFACAHQSLKCMYLKQNQATWFMIACNALLTINAESCSTALFSQHHLCVHEHLWEAHEHSIYFTFDTLLALCAASLGNGVRCVHDRPKHSAALYAGRFNIFTSQLGGAIKTRRPSFVSPRMMSSMSGATGIEEICRAAHILCADEEAANAALERIKTGENFGQIASEVSSCPSKEKGGDLGWFKKGQMVAEFEAACFENDPGTIVKVQTQFGWHVVR